MSLSVSPLVAADLEDVSLLAFSGDKPRSHYETYLREQFAGYRSVLVGRTEGRIAGYVTVVWDSRYPGFSPRDIPEIVDLTVLPAFRRRGFGERLVRECELLARSRGHGEIGLAVGLVSDFGAAQRLYVRVGFVPDGRGLYCGNRAVQFGEAVTANDELALFLSKRI